MTTRLINNDSKNHGYLISIPLTVTVATATTSCGREAPLPAALGAGALAACGGRRLLGPRLYGRGLTRITKIMVAYSEKNGMIYLKGISRWQ